MVQEKKKRKKFSKEFKEEAVKLITEQGYGISEAARNLGINPAALGRWKKNLEDIGDKDYPNLAAIKDENRLLRRENKRLAMERDILKKAAAFFAKESE